MAALAEDDAALTGGVYRVAIIGDQRTGKTEFLKWFFESVENKGKVEQEHIMVGEFIRESDYVRVEGSLHRFQSAFNSDQLREDWKGRYSSKYERKAILQRKNFNKRYRATVSPLFYDLPLGGIIDGGNESGDDVSLKPGTNAGGPKLQVWDTSGKASFSRLGLIFEEFRAIDLFIVMFSIDDKSTFDNVKKWKKDFINQLQGIGKHRRIPMILIGTKLDKEENRQVTQDRVYDYCRRRAPFGGNVPYFEVSSRVPAEGSTVTDIFEEAIKLIEINRNLNQLSETKNTILLSREQIKLIQAKYEAKGNAELDRSCKTCGIM